MMARAKTTAAIVESNKRGRARDPSADRGVRIPEIELPIREADRRALISEAAYYRAAKRGFEPGHDLEDWLAAEAEVAAGRITVDRD